MGQEGDVSVARLIKWLNTHDGFVCELEARTVPGQPTFAEIVRMSTHAHVQALAAGSLCGVTLASEQQPDETILVVPSTAMLNPITLAASTPSLIPPRLIPKPPSNPRKRSRPSALNTTQLLTLELALSRQPDYRSEWAPFIDTLPQHFRPWHPLTWLVKPDKEDKAWSSLTRLAQVLDASTSLKLNEVERRWNTDQARLRQLLDDETVFPHLAVPVSGETLLWAWLNVNTRTVSIALGLSGNDTLFNHTFVPLLDLINHSSDPKLSLQDPHQVSSRSARQMRGMPLVNKPGSVDFRMSGPSRGLNKGEQVFFAYGRHSSATLFAEYGFHEAGQLHGVGAEVDLNHHVMEAWKAEESSKEKQEALEAIACWRHNLLILSPTPHASYALLMTLRVLCLPSDSAKLAAIRKGQVGYVSPANEELALAKLSSICTTALDETRQGAQSFSEAAKDMIESEGSADVKAAVDQVQALWRERIGVIESILERIRLGQPVD